MSINSVTLVGRMTKDPQLRYSQHGKAICNFTLACNRPFKNAQGENEADFINIVQFGNGAEPTANYTSKGSLVGITGRIQSRNYENKEGQRVFVTEVVAASVQFLETKRSNSEKSNSQPKQNNQFGNWSPNEGEPLDIDDSDLPF